MTVSGGPLIAGSITLSEMQLMMWEEACCSPSPPPSPVIMFNSFLFRSCNFILFTLIFALLYLPRSCVLLSFYKSSLLFLYCLPQFCWYTPNWWCALHVLYRPPHYTPHTLFKLFSFLLHIPIYSLSLIFLMPMDTPYSSLNFAKSVLSFIFHRPFPLYFLSQLLPFYIHPDPIMAKANISLPFLTIPETYYLSHRSHTN